MTIYNVKTLQEICARYQAGEGFKALNAYGSATTIRKILVENGIKIRRQGQRSPGWRLNNPHQKKSLGRNQEITEQYLTGRYTYDSLGKLYGLTRERIRQIVNKNKNDRVRKVFIPAADMKILQDIREGMHFTDIVEKHNVSKYRVNKLAKKFNLTVRKHRYDWNAILHDYKVGKVPLSALALKHGFQQSQIYTILKGRGLKANRPKKKPIRNIDWNKIVDAYKHDLDSTVTEICNKHKIKPGQLYTYMAKKNITYRRWAA